MKCDVSFSQGSISMLFRWGEHVICKNVLPAYSSAKIIKIKRVFPELWSQMYCHVFYEPQCKSRQFVLELCDLRPSYVCHAGSSRPGLGQIRRSESYVKRTTCLLVIWHVLHTKVINAVSTGGSLCMFYHVGAKCCHIAAVRFTQLSDGKLCLHVHRSFIVYISQSPLGSLLRFSCTCILCWWWRGSSLI